ncbi:hypothetical protein [Paenibacillus spongiae]|uniref:Uncharacterized protein n=1 Tax=Paenibacillus spongiae TaxID=2909671 RepID=A0ABY5S199_9BACL|nr:hypothetical protein [Paenibacillus spongiae]UVI27632.1 hypothetical protein L1F29_19390 [Paenibacillus spongiae]
MPCNCQSPRGQTAASIRSFPFSPMQPGTFPQPGPMPLPGGQQGIFPFPQTPMQPGTSSPSQLAVPPQLSPSNLTTILGQYPRPAAQPPADMVFLYNLLKYNPAQLQNFIQQRPQTLQQAVQFAQLGTGSPRYSDARVLQGYCYNRWSLAFTFNDVFLIFPVTNLFGFVIGYCFPTFTPCLIPNFLILFALC